MDEVVARDFWKKKSLEGSTRWTGEEMLDYEKERLSRLVAPGARILDLGSGTGDLSRAITPPDGSLIAVDYEPGMAKAFENETRFRFESGNVVDYQLGGSADLILLFGVVTCIGLKQEEYVYDNIRDTLANQGVAVVKNQCSDGEEFEIDDWSETLGARYVGRYPSLPRQRERLEERFREVQAEIYPVRFKRHPNSTHVAFFCRGPVR